MYVPAPAENEPLKHFTLGCQALAAGRLEQAIHRFKEQRRLQPNLRLPFEELKRGEEGVTIALDRQAQYFEGYVQRAAIRLARAILQSLDDRDPRPDCKAALDDATRAIDLRPDALTPRLHRANLLLFSARYSRGSGKDVTPILQIAEGDLHRACEIDSRNPAVMHNQGIIHFYLANVEKEKGSDPLSGYTRAIERMTAAAGLSPEDPYICKDLGTCRLAMARVLIKRHQRPGVLLRRAEEDLTAALFTEPTLYAAWYERGMVQFALREFEKAIADWRRCGVLDPAKAKQLAPLIQEAEQKKAGHPSSGSSDSDLVTS